MISTVKNHSKWAAYGQSKLANLLSAYELQRRFEPADITDIISVACHLGYAATNLQYRGSEQSGSRLRLAIIRIANAVVAQSPAKGVLPLLYSATAAEVTGREYYGSDGFKNIRGYPTEQTSNDASYDEKTPKRCGRPVWN